MRRLDHRGASDLRAGYSRASFARRETVYRPNFWDEGEAREIETFFHIFQSIVRLMRNSRPRLLKMRLCKLCKYSNELSTRNLIGI